MRRIAALVALPLVLLVGVGVSGCKCDPNGENCELTEYPDTPPAADPFSISISSGDGQVGPEGVPLEAELVGRYLENGSPAYVNCIFEIESGGGTLRATGYTDLGVNPGDRIWVKGNGYCRATWVMGTPGAGSVKLHFFRFKGDEQDPEGCRYYIDYATGIGTWLTCPPDEKGFVRFTARAHGPPAKLVVGGGDGQPGEPGQPLRARPWVRVTDAGDNPVPGINVVFVADGGSGTPASPVSARTNRNGNATMPVDWVLGPAVGSQFLQAVAGEVGSPLALTGNPALFTATARVGPVAARIDIVEGDNQNTIAGSPVPLPVRVRVTSASGEPVPGVLVDFVPDQGSVSISPATTFADGIATPGTWRPGFNEAGTFSLTATARGDNIANNPVVFTATVSVGQGGTNTLQLYNGTSATANIVVDGEAVAPSNSLGPSQTRDVQIFTAVNTSVAIYALIGGSQVATTRCTVTAAAWQGGTRPLVALFSDGRYLLTCSNF